MIENYLVDSSVDLLTKVKIQAQVLVPLIKELRTELGEEQANRLLKKALRGWSQELFATIATEADGTPKQKWAVMNDEMIKAAIPGVEAEMLRLDSEAHDFNVTACRYADFFRGLNEPQLGTLLLCSADFDIAAAGKDEVQFSRTQTIMEGASYCDFRYRFANSELS